MAVLRVPTRTDLKAYSMTVEFDGLYYDLTFRFNARDDHWFMDVVHAGARVVTGIKVVEDDDWLKQLVHLEADGRLPPGGTFSVRDTGDEDKDPDDGDFGDRVVLLYTEAS